MTYHRFFLLLFVLALLTGCGNKQRLGGKVTFADDGSPVVRGVVFFSTPTLVAQGAIREDGSYVVGTDRLDDGLPYGEYEVYVIGTDHIEFKNDRKGAKREHHTPMVDPKYSKAETSGLRFTADGKTKRFDLQLDRASSGKK